MLPKMNLGEVAIARVGKRSKQRMGEVDLAEQEIIAHGFRVLWQLNVVEGTVCRRL